MRFQFHQLRQLPKLNRLNLTGLRALSRALCLAAVLLLTIPCGAEAVTRGAFLAALLDARGLSSNVPAGKDAVAFVQGTGIVTDGIGGPNAHVTRREALRWCIQSLGLAFEAGVLSEVSAGFSDEKALTPFERGCLAVAVNMTPALLSRDRSFRGAQRLTEKEMRFLLDRVRQAGDGLTLEVTLAPVEGLTLLLHRDGVPTGVPRWRVYADGFQDKAAAEAAQAFFKSKGFEMSMLQPQYEWFLRSPVLEDYRAARRLVSLIRQRKLAARLLPSVSNSNTELLPRYWAMLTIDPGLWRMIPAVSSEGPAALTPLSRIVKDNGLSAAINAGFFAVTGRRQGYPIGLLRRDGAEVHKLYNGRGCLGWNDENEAAFGLPSLVNGELVGSGGESWSDMPFAIQAGPLLLSDGVVQGNDEGFSNSLLSVRHPRSVVGLTADGEWFFLAVDGRNGLHAAGATMSELTDILRSYEVPYALNLDGGGSTELIVRGRLFTSPSEGKERPISYALGVVPAPR